MWIGLAMVAGLLLGQWIPGVNTALDKVQMTVFPCRSPSAY